MKVIWTDTAVLSFEYTIDYLIKKFGVSSAENFYNEVMTIIDSINKNNDIGVRVNSSSVYRKFVIAKKTSLYYSIRLDEIYLHCFWNNREDSARLKRILGL